MEGQAARAHRAPKAGPKAAKKQERSNVKRGLPAKPDRYNPRAFSVSKIGGTKRKIQRNLDRLHQKEVVPLVDRTEIVAPPPCMVAVMGPPASGKTTLIRSLLKLYTGQTVTDISGPITVVANKKKRLTFFEVPADDLNSMIDVAKVADLVLLVINGSYGFELESFEFLNLLQAHGFPKVMGVCTHMDLITRAKSLSATRKKLKHRFWTEIYQGAKMFYFGTTVNGKYLKSETKLLTLQISRIKFRPLTWRNQHPYLLVDRVEDITSPAAVVEDPTIDRRVVLYGYVRGSHLKETSRVHLIGVGDFGITELGAIADPCPLPEDKKKKGELGASKGRSTLRSKDTLLYAPMSNIGTVRFDKDAVYIDLGKVKYSRPEMLDVNSTRNRMQQGGTSGYIDSDETKHSADSKASSSLLPSNLLRRLQDANGDIDQQLYASELNIIGKSTIKKNKFPQSEGKQEFDIDKEDIDSLKGGGDEVNDIDGERDEDEAESDETEDDDDEDDDDEDDDDEDDEYEEEDDDGTQWKENLALKAEKRFHARRLSRTRSLHDYIYGSRDRAGERDESDDGNEKSDDDDDDAFFTKKNSATRNDWTNANFRQIHKESVLDSSKRMLPSSESSDRSEAEDRNDIEGSGSDDDADDGMTNRKSGSGAGQDWFATKSSSFLLKIKTRFVTGGKEAWQENVDENDDEKSDDDGDVYGDFEDLESGKEFYGAELNNADSDDDLDSDHSSSSVVAVEEAKDIEDSMLKERFENAAKKALQKLKFDVGYDAEKGTLDNSDNDEGDQLLKKREKKKKHRGNGNDEENDHEDDEDEETLEYLASVRAAKEEQARLNATEFSEEGEGTRLKMEGFRNGLYVRVVLDAVPAEFTTHFRPSAPIVLGGVVASESRLGLTRCRVRRHRWHRGVLKTNDPIVVSCGWRRFQTVPVYCMEDGEGSRHRYLKYTPQHMHCHAVMYAPLCPPNTPLLGFKTLSSRAPSFRVSLTGVVLEVDHSFAVVKKLKLTGTPARVHRKTAFIRGMFNSALEVAKFQGAKLRTVSGVRGEIKKTHAHDEPGSFRATFEDKILMSDIVFCRLWVPVKPTEFYNPVTSLLSAPDAHQVPAQLQQDVGRRNDEINVIGRATKAASATKDAWAEQAGEVVKRKEDDHTDAPYVEIGENSNVENYGSDYELESNEDADEIAGDTQDEADDSKDMGAWMPMRTVAELRRAAALPVPVSKDSLYKPVERKTRTFNPIPIPKSLEAALPYASKSKDLAKKSSRGGYVAKRSAVVLEPHERKRIAFLNKLGTIRNEKKSKRKAKSVEKREEKAKKKAKIDDFFSVYQKASAKKKYRSQGLELKARQQQEAGRRYTQKKK